MSTIQWVEHKGKRILICDFSKMDEKGYISGTDAMEKELLAQPRGSKPLLLVDVTDSTMTKVTSERGKQTVDVLSKAGVVTVTAMVGITGLKKVIAQAISRDVHFADDRASAMDWLVAQ